MTSYKNMETHTTHVLLLTVSIICTVSGSRARFEDSPPRIVEDPSDLIVSKGEPATLNCKAEGRPNPTVEWYKDGERVETDRDDPRSHRMLLPSGSLFFLRIVHGRRSKPDEGVYTCVARNYLGEAVSRNASLEVAILRDDFRQAPSDVVVAAGEPAVLECVPPRGHPEPTVSWKRNNARVSNKDDRISMRGGKLMISHTRKSDAGMYVCVGTNMVGERDSDPAELVVYERPVLMRRPVNQVVMEEETVDFLCEVHGDPAPTVRWRREEGELPRGRFEIRSDNSLRLTRVRGEDEGTYTCMSENSVGKTEASAMLQVHVPPQITIKPQDQISAQGRSVTFRCGTRGNPSPAIFWKKEGSQMLLFPGQPLSQSGRYSVSMSGELSITDVHLEDSGYYICQAISVAGSVLTKALLEVEGGPSDRVPPIIRQGPANQTLALGSIAQLQCHAIGGPSLRIVWEKDGERIVGDNPRMTLMENGTLQITNVEDTDSGMYTCVVLSATGESSWSGTLTMREDGAPGSSVPRVSESIQLPGPPQKPVVTDVTRNTVTLTWQSNPHEGGAAVTAYIIEAFSQSVGSVWQTVADHVKQEKHTVIGLYPNTVYLFIVRAVNSYGLSDPSPISEPIRTQDGSPTEQGMDRRQVQRELGEVSLYLQKPVVISPTSAQVSWTVARQSQYVQGYRLLYRSTGSAWMVQDVKGGPELSTVLSDLRTDTEYEVKVRPYFNELQGLDSPLVQLRTPEEVLSAPPQAVSVVQLSNSSSISVSWEPPPADVQSGTVLEYKVWCLGSDSEMKTESHINRTVDRAVLSILLTGLLPDLQYSVMVAAVTILGVGQHSPPIDLVLTLSLDMPSDPLQKDSSLSLSEQITGVVSQPAFIAGLGVASWLVLMGFSGWLYCRHRRRKELGHYTTSFAYTPAVGFAHSEGSGLSNGSRPRMLGSNMGNYPWLADSWPAPGLAHNGKDSVNCCSGKLDSTDRYYNVGISNYLSQSEKYSSVSTDSPIYSTICTAAAEDLQGLAYYSTYSNTPCSQGSNTPCSQGSNTPCSQGSNTPYTQGSNTPYTQGSNTPYTQGSNTPYTQGSNTPYTQGPDPNAITPVLSNSGLFGLEQDLDQWTIQSGQSVEYAKLQYARTSNAKLVKQRSMCPSSKPAPLNWEDVLSLPLPANKERGYTKRDRDEGRNSSSDEDEEDWCPPLPARTYLMDGSREELPSLPSSRREELTQGTISSLQSTATLPPSPQEETRPPLQHFDLLACYGPGSQVSHSNPNLFANKDAYDVSGPYHTNQWGDTFMGENFTSERSGRGQSPPFLAESAHAMQGHRTRSKKKGLQEGQHRRELHDQADLPPPPAPPPAADNPLQLLADVLGCSRTPSADNSPALQRRGDYSSPQKRGPAMWGSQDEGVIPYCPSSFLPRGQMSGYGSLGGGASSRVSTGQREPGAARSRDEVVLLLPSLLNSSLLPWCQRRAED
ncbi:roundabout homolog 2 isoform X3 [Coregonus clupeaformis]|uniref:roundabout homolog 2 isoform X3 n=1 Tax=Coregonus clupeaformis TaxID=59861 RepID=UPI001BE128A8|nr:roundabout homolog 2 isoform X3 [Coregonus clupeaformis]